VPKPIRRPAAIERIEALRPQIEFALRALYRCVSPPNLSMSGGLLRLVAGAGMLHRF
jgi:hypothetical protein